MDETVTRRETEIYRWDGPKAKMTLSGTMLGTLVLTGDHLLFLSTGGNDMGRRLRSAAIGGQLAGDLFAKKTGGLDLAALDNPGSFAIPLGQVDEARAASRWDRTKFLAVRLWYIRELVHTSSSTLVYRAERELDGQPVVLKLLDRSAATPARSRIQGGEP